MTTARRGLEESEVELAKAHRFRPALNESLPAGTTGLVRWDEGGEEVVVEFAKSVPDSGFALPHRQAWVPRSALTKSRSRR